MAPSSRLVLPQGLSLLDQISQGGRGHLTRPISADPSGRVAFQCRGETEGQSAVGSIAAERGDGQEVGVFGLERQGGVGGRWHLRRRRTGLEGFHESHRLPHRRGQFYLHGQLGEECRHDDGGPESSSRHREIGCIIFRRDCVCPSAHSSVPKQSSRKRSNSISPTATTAAIPSPRPPHDAHPLGRGRPILRSRLLNLHAQLHQPNPPPLHTRRPLSQSHPSSPLGRRRHHLLEPESRTHALAEILRRWRRQTRGGTAHHGHCRGGNVFRDRCLGEVDVSPGVRSDHGIAWRRAGGEESHELFGE
mmetsp:Transcript_4156/g.9274  ORF Transcript_4156/g.9274 Transcript_4156/m.9274 type:complete len:305 (+) Transcript_4156:753-1667(+)